VSTHDTATGDSLTRVRTAAVAWFAVVVFGRLYTVVLCDVPDRVFGFDGLCHTSIRNIPIYLWVELVVYGPLMWFALHQVVTDVFGDVPTESVALRRHRRLEFAATAAIAMFLYGVGVHVADTIEVFSRGRMGVTDGELYELVYFIDEGVSHYIQFTSLFFVIGWFVLYDRSGRRAHQTLALFLGAAHGVERGLGTTEGEKWYLTPVVIAWVVAAAWLRHRRVGPAAFEEFFFRYAVVLAVMMPACQIVYALWFDGFQPPSEFDNADYAQLAVGAIALTVVGTAAAIGIDRRLRRAR
jgi:hypothetical protein